MPRIWKDTEDGLRYRLLQAAERIKELEAANRALKQLLERGLEQQAPADALSPESEAILRR